MPQRGEQMNADERKQRVREVTVNVLGGMKDRAIGAYTEVHPEQSEVERAAVPDEGHDSNGGVTNRSRYGSRCTAEESRRGSTATSGGSAGGGWARRPPAARRATHRLGSLLRAYGLHGTESRETHAEAPYLLEIEGQREPEHTA